MKITINIDNMQEVQVLSCVRDRLEGFIEAANEMTNRDDVEQHIKQFSYDNWLGSIESLADLHHEISEGIMTAREEMGFTNHQVIIKDEQAVTALLKTLINPKDL